jgi:peptidoglycan/LPS O-acetylase OafA/YrhL
MGELKRAINPLNASRDIPSLNGIRALAVILVLISHAGFGDIVPGGFGVTVFFFLSGYLITTLLLKEFLNKNYLDIKSFYIRRFLRLTPPLLITLAVTYLAVFAGISDGGATLNGLMSQIFYFANYYAIYFEQADNIPAGTGVLWSLAVEEHFYFVYPLVLIFLLRLKNNSGIAFSLLLICFLVLVWRLNLVLDSDFFEERIYYATDTRIDSILFGCLLAVSFNPVKFNGSNNELRLKHWLVIILAVAVLIFTFLYRDIIFRETMRYTLQGLALMPLFYFSISRYKHWVFSFLNTSVVQKIGIYSYSIYLIHLFIIKLILKETDQEISSIYLLFSSSILSILYAFLVHKYIERYFYKIRKKFV